MADSVRQPLKFDPSAVGTTGLRQFGGYVVDEFLRELRGLNAARVYREMSDNDPVVGAVIFAISMLIRQTKWRVQAVDETGEAEVAQKFVEEIMDDMSTPWSSVVAEVCTMFPYGFAPMEITWKRRVGLGAADGSKRSRYDDGKIGIRSLALRAQNTIIKWEFDPEDGTIDGMWQQPWAGPMVCIPIEKLLIFRTTDEKNNPEGRSILRNAYRAWHFKKRIEEIEGIGIERDLAGLPIAMIPGEYFDPSADAQQKATLQAWQRLVTQVRRDQQEGILIPSDRDSSGNLLFDFKLLSTGGTRSFDTSKVIDRYNRAIATSVLADFIFLGQQSVGSFALSSDKTALFATAIGAFTHSIAEVFNRHLLPRLWQLNGMDPAMMPTLVPGDLEKQNLGEVSAFIQSLTAAGATMFPDRELENHLRELAGLPLAPEDGIDGDLAAEGEPPEDTPPPADEELEPAEKRLASPPKRVHKKLIYNSDGLLVGVEETEMNDDPS